MSEKYRPEGSDVEYVVPSLDDPADGPQAFRDFADSIPTSLSPAIIIHKQESDYTLAVGDLGCIVEIDTSSGSKTVTVPNDKDGAFPIGAVVVVTNTGSNRKALVTVVADTGVTIKDTSVRKISHNRMVALVKIDPNFWLINAGGGSPDTAVPLAPTLISATPGQESVTLLWEKPKDDGGAPVTEYIVERSYDQEIWSFAGSRDATDVGIVIDGLNPKAAYWMRVRAQNSRGFSEPSNAMSVTPLG